MNRYAGKIKVVGIDKMCFPVDPETYEATSSSCYDPSPYLEHPESNRPVETISEDEFRKRKCKELE